MTGQATGGAAGGSQTSTAELPAPLPVAFRASRGTPFDGNVVFLESYVVEPVERFRAWVQEQRVSATLQPVDLERVFARVVGELWWQHEQRFATEIQPLVERLAASNGHEFEAANRALQEAQDRLADLQERRVAEAMDRFAAEHLVGLTEEQRDWLRRLR